MPKATWRDCPATVAGRAENTRTVGSRGARMADVRDLVAGRHRRCRSYVSVAGLPGRQRLSNALGSSPEVVRRAVIAVPAACSASAFPAGARLRAGRSRIHRERGRARADRGSRVGTCPALSGWPVRGVARGWTTPTASVAATPGSCRHPAAPTRHPIARGAYGRWVVRQDQPHRRSSERRREALARGRRGTGRLRLHVPADRVARGRSAPEPRRAPAGPCSSVRRDDGPGQSNGACSGRGARKPGAQRRHGPVGAATCCR